jgi:hypothetical protein
MNKSFLEIISLLQHRVKTNTLSVVGYSTPLDDSATVELIELGQQVSIGPRYLGSVRVCNFVCISKCSYDEVIAEAQNQARLMGGNLLAITKHIKPIFGVSCHKIVADVYVKK